MAVVPLPDFRPRQHNRTLIGLLVLLLVGVMSWAAVAAMRFDPPISCQRHVGPFSNAFSADFDINRADCRLSWMKRSPTVHFWGVPPYVGINW
jgi:hypothetical protein